MNLKLSQKAGVDGRLFGSVTNHEVSEELNKQGFAVAKSQVRMPNGPLKTVGEYTVSVNLHTDVTIDVAVRDRAQQQLYADVPDPPPKLA